MCGRTAHSGLHSDNLRAGKTATSRDLPWQNPGKPMGFCPMFGENPLDNPWENPWEHRKIYGNSAIFPPLLTGRSWFARWTAATSRGLPAIGRRLQHRGPYFSMVNTVKNTRKMYKIYT